MTSRYRFIGHTYIMASATLQGPQLSHTMVSKHYTILYGYGTCLFITFYTMGLTLQLN